MFYTVMILSFWTDMPGQTVQTQIRLLLEEEQSDQSDQSADPDQTAPRGAVWSGSTMFAIPSASFGHITLW